MYLKSVKNNSIFLKLILDVIDYVSCTTAGWRRVCTSAMFCRNDVIFWLYFNRVRIGAFSDDNQRKGVR